MNPLFIAVTDRGALRAGWLEPAPLQPNLPAQPRTPTVRWVEELSFVHPRQHFVEQVSALSGAYSATASSGMGGGAPRRMQSSSSNIHWKIEADRRAIHDLAEALTRVVDREKPEAWSLAAPADVHLELLDALPVRLRGRLLTLVPKNLVSADTDSLIAHFRGPTEAQRRAPSSTE